MRLRLHYPPRPKVAIYLRAGGRRESCPVHRPLHPELRIDGADGIRTIAVLRSLSTLGGELPVRNASVQLT
ncbi:hypothetical protein GCM10028796_04880 [Ramlibacter monticola]